MSVDIVALGYLASFGNGRDAKAIVDPSGDIPIYGSGGKFGTGTDYLHDGDAVLFGRKGTVDRPQFVSGRFWLVDTAYFAVPESHVDAKYLYYWATTVPYGLISTNTAVPSVTSADLSRLKVPLPRLPTQRAIADYLDRETAEIDAMAAELDELTDRLEARQLSTLDLAMQHAEAIHGSTSIGFNFRVINGDRGASYPSAKEITDIGIPFVNAGDLVDGLVSLTSCKRIAPSKYAEMGGAKLLSGDILFCLRGSLGKSALVLFDDGALASSLCAVRARQGGRMSPRFLLEAMKSTSFQDQIRFSETGSAQPNLGADQLARFQAPAPPLDEQRRIVEHLDAVFAEIDSMIADAQELKALLAERRSALISEVVAGRKEVAVS